MSEKRYHAGKLHPPNGLFIHDRMTRCIVCEVYDSAGPGMAERICAALNAEEEKGKS
jgi:hypothetical protein